MASRTSVERSGPFTRASPAPTGFAVCTQHPASPRTLWELACQRKRCVSWQYSKCADAIASRLAPTENTASSFAPDIVGVSLLAKTVCQTAYILNVPTPSRASPAPTGIFGENTASSFAPDIVGVSLLAKTVCQTAYILNVPTPSRASPAPTGIFGENTASSFAPDIVGAGLPKVVCQPANILNVPTPSRAGSLPQVLGCEHSIQPPPDIVGVSLLAKTVCQTAYILNFPTPSRASPAPTGFLVKTQHPASPRTLWGLPA
jgi:hypothetical protein